MTIIVCAVLVTIGAFLVIIQKELLLKRAARASMDRERVEKELKESEERFRLLAASAQDAIIVINHEEKFSFWNDAAVKIFGYSQEEALGKNCHKLIVPPHYHYSYNKNYGLFCISGIGPAIGTTLEFTALRKDGSEFPIEISLSAIPMHGKWGAVAIIRDISQRRLNEETIRSLVITDPLTGFYNRRGLMTLAEQQIKIAERKGYGLLLLFADLDELKLINDTLGHQAGDAAIVEAAQVLGKVFRKMDIIARIGGDEFAVLAPETSTEYSCFVEKRLRDQLALHNALAGRAYTLSMSTGMAYYDPEEPCSLDDMLSRADSRMYEQKRRKNAQLNKVKIRRLIRPQRQDLSLAQASSR